MTQSKKISFLSAILINVNSIVGVGLFVNTSILTQQVGIWGFLSYLAGALLLFPIALTMAELATEHPVAGGMFFYSNQALGKLGGFISGWSYFLAKTTSFALLSHLLLKFITEQCGPIHSSYFPLLHGLFFALLWLLLVGGVSIGGKIQYLFTALKIIPLLSIVAVSSYFFSIKPFLQTNIPTFDILSSLSLVTFALASFEIICSIGHLVENAQKNIYWVVIISFITVACLYMLFQGSIAGGLGLEQITTSNPILFIFTKHIPAYAWITNVISITLYSAVFGTIFTILGSNSWNLYVLASQNSFPFKEQICKLSQTNVPYISTLIKLSCAWIILLISRNQIALQNMFVLNVSISYGLSVISCLQLATISRIKKIFICGPALLSCSYLLALSFFKVSQSGISFSFLSLYLTGFGLYFYKNYFS